MKKPISNLLSTELLTLERELYAAGMSEHFVEDTQSAAPNLMADDDPTTIDTEKVRVAVEDVTKWSTIVAMEPPVKPKMQLRTPLAIASASMALNPLTRHMSEGDTVKGGCLEAEVRLVRALKFHRDARPAAPDHRPGAILFDQTGKPYAYQKSSGDPTAFAWRDTVVNTAEGPRFLPAGSFFEVDHSMSQDPLERYAGAGLISLEGVLPREVRFVRFATHLLSSRLAYYAHLGATLHEDVHPAPVKLQDNLAEATSLSNEVVARQAHTLLRTSRIVRVTS